MCINVGADPAKATQQISDPIYKLLEVKIDNLDSELKDM